MFEFIFNKLIEYTPQLSTYAIIALIVGLLVWKLTSFYINTNFSINKLLKIETTLDKLYTAFVSLNKVLLEKTVISQSCFSNENSPRVINDLGKKLYEESGAKEVYNEIKLSLMIELENKKFDSLLELEQSCFEVLLQKRDDQKFKNIQNFAFEHPKFQAVSLTYTDILFVLSLKLRDDFREKHPDLKLG